MPELNGLSRSLITLEQDSTLIAVIDLSQSSWLVAGIVPGVERHPLKKLPPDEAALLQLLQRWRNETADMLVHEVLSRDMRDRKAVARYAGLTGAPDESGAKRREQGLAKAGNARVRRGMIQLAWRFLLHQKGSALAQWYRARTADARPGTRKTLIVALARKLLVGLWRLVTTGEAPDGVVLRPAP